MLSNYIFRNASEALPVLMNDLLYRGDEVGSRAGRVKELMHVGITLTDAIDRELLVEGRKANIAAQIAETVWVLNGRNDVAWLSHYLPRAADFSDDGFTWRAGYGPRLRGWPRRSGHAVEPVDQLRHVFQLLKANPLDRRAVATLYDPQIDHAPGKDIPCNNWLSFSSRLGELDLHVAIRSNDVMWGWSGINAFEWSTLLEVMAGLLGIKPGALHFSTTSFHLYDRHWAKAEELAKATRHTALFPSPRFDAATLPSRDFDGFDQMLTSWLQVEEMIRHGDDVDDVVNLFPEPMLRSWLRVIQWWWSGDERYLTPLKGTRLHAATVLAIQPKRDPGPATTGVEIALDPATDRTFVAPTPFLTEVMALHVDKERAYGGSWKRRGEMLGIMANIARKVDRLGQNGAGDTATDTAIDLMVYLAKYRTWLSEQGWPINGVVYDSDKAISGNQLLMKIEEEWTPVRLSDVDTDQIEASLTENFEELEQLVMAQSRGRGDLVDQMLHDAYQLARALWTKDDDYRGADLD
jgi:thymidylate synthase